MHDAKAWNGPGWAQPGARQRTDMDVHGRTGLVRRRIVDEQDLSASGPPRPVSNARRRQAPPWRGAFRRTRSWDGKGKSKDGTGIRARRPQRSSGACSMQRANGFIVSREACRGLAARIDVLCDSDSVSLSLSPTYRSVSACVSHVNSLACPSPMQHLLPTIASASRSHTHRALSPPSLSSSSIQAAPLSLSLSSSFSSSFS